MQDFQRQQLLLSVQIDQNEQLNAVIVRDIQHPEENPENKWSDEKSIEG